MKCSLIRGIRTMMLLSQMPEEEGMPTGSKAVSLTEPEILRISSRLTRAAGNGREIPFPVLLTRSLQQQRARQTHPGKR